MALLLGLITALALGVGDFIAGQVTKRVPPLIVVLYAQGFGTIIMLPVAMVSGHSLTLTAIIWGLLAGISLSIGFLFYFRSLSLGKMGVVSSITGILSAIIPVFTGLLIGERPGAWALIAVVVIILAIILITKKETVRETPVKGNSAVFAQAALAGILIGLFFVFLHIPTAGESMWTVSFTMTGSFLAVATVLLIRRANFLRVSKSAWVYILANGFFADFRHNHLYPRC